MYDFKDLPFVFDVYSDEELGEISKIELLEMLTDCRNDMCEKCGAYKKEHLGACEGCRWKS